VLARGGRSWAGAMRARIGVGRFSLGLDRDITFLFWALAIFNFGFGLYAYLFTIYLEDLGATAFQIGLLVGLQGMLRIAINLPAGVIVDRFPRRRIIVLTTWIAVPAVLCYAFAQEWWQALPGMLLIVLGNLGTPAFSSYLADVGSPRDRKRAFSLVYVVGPSIALALSPVTGGWLADKTSFRVVYCLSAAIFAITALILMRLTDRPPVKHAGRAASYREAIDVPVIRALGLLQFGVLSVLMIGVTLLPNYLKEVHHIGVEAIGWFGSIAAIGSALLSLIVSRVRLMTTMRTIGVAPVGVGILCLVTLVTGNPLLIAMAFLGRGGFMVAWSLFAAVLSDTVPPKLMSRSFAFTEFLGSIGLALSPFLAGALYDWRHGAPLVVTCIATPILTALAFWMERHYVKPAIAARTESDNLAPTIAVAEGVA
jgi:DHA1 family multidrug resistance protein-like MFS transporter